MNAFDEPQGSALGWEGVDPAPPSVGGADQHVFWVEVGDRFGEGLCFFTARSGVAEVELVVGPQDERRTVVEPVGSPSNWGDFGDLAGGGRDGRDDGPPRLLGSVTEFSYEIAAMGVVDAPAELQSSPRPRWLFWRSVVASIALVAAARVLLLLANVGGRHP